MRSILGRGLSALLLVVCAARAAGAAPLVFAQSGPIQASIAPSLDDFRAALGVLNPNAAGDLVPDGFAAANSLSADCFNLNFPVGVLFGMPGTGFEVSERPGTPGGTARDFGELNPQYVMMHEPFTPDWLFRPLGSTVSDVSFFVPGTSTPAYTNGFGAVFSDVHVFGTSSLTFFDPFGSSLGTFVVPSATGDGTFSFLGVIFNAGEQVARVRIVASNHVLPPQNVSVGLAVLDDFILRGPQSLTPAAVPEPGTVVLVLTGVGVVLRRRRA